MAARFYLETSEDPLKPILWPAEEKTVTIGRGGGNLVPLDDDQASRRHCSITRRAGRYVLRDLNSRNGTFVDGCAVRTRKLADGARIRVGSSVIRFSVGEEALPLGAGLFQEKGEERLSALSLASVGVSVLGLFLWYMAAAGLLLGGFAALNAKLRPKLRGMWIGALGAALGGLGFGYHCVAGGLAPAWETLASANLQIECRGRLKELGEALATYRAHHDGHPPSSLRELYPVYIESEEFLYCPAAESVLGEGAEEAAYAYSRANAASRRSGDWAARDPDVEAHGEGGMVLFSDGQVRWLKRHEFAESVRRSAARGAAP